MCSAIRANVLLAPDIAKYLARKDLAKMNALVVADRASEWHRLKALVLDSVSSPITRRVYNLGLDEFIAWYTADTADPRPAGFTKATVMAWRVALEVRRLGPISINVRITAVRKLASRRPTTV